jgi:hypothetical protein
VGREQAVSGSLLTGMSTASSDQVSVRTYANAYPGADGARIYMNGIFEAAS